MVWKFNTEAAEKQHAERASRIEPGAADTNTPAPVARPTVHYHAPVAAPGGRAEPVLVENAELDAHMRNIGAGGQGRHVEPGWGEPAQEPEASAPTSVFGQAEPGLGYAHVDVDNFPQTDSAWDVQPFQGTPDELPDLRPIPPAPEEHPGHLYRNSSTFGHALRMPHDDPRQQLWTDQRRDRGFDDTELWGLDDTFARFILPRLKALRQQKLEAPNSKMDLALWYSFLDKMIRAFELLLPEGGGAWSRGTLNDRERAQLQEGLDLFRQYYFSLCS